MEGIYHKHLFEVDHMNKKWKFSYLTLVLVFLGFSAGVFCLVRTKIKVYNKTMLKNFDTVKFSLRLT